MPRFLVLLPSLALAACALLRLPAESESFYAATALVGRVSGAHGAPVVVAAYAARAGRIEVADRVWLHEAGAYELVVPPGEYALFAFADANGNLRYDAGEPAGDYGNGSPVAVSREWAVSQLAEANAAPRKRSAVLAGRPGVGGVDRGAIVCACFGVGTNEIAAAVARGCTSVAAIGAATQAGTNCGSCRAEIRNILDARLAAPPASPRAVVPA